MPLELRKEGATDPEFATDLWDGYRPARARLIDSIRKHDLTNVIIATGATTAIWSAPPPHATST